MLISGGLRVVHLTTHRSLRRACDAVTKESVLSMVALTDESFRAWGFAQPRIGVAALNPHASDGGLIGDEEEREIAPAVASARERGIEATGPVPADIVFHQAIEGRYDAVLAMYHDQGHIPVKVHGFEQSVSVNLGLPFVRTSVDHGTAFDIAGKGVASAVSMVESIVLAAALASGRGLPRRGAETLRGTEARQAMADRVTIYIDGSNLYHTLRSVIGRIDVDIGKLAAKLVGDRRLVRIYYYNAPVDQSKEPEAYGRQQRFLHALRSIEYCEVILGRLVYRDSPHEHPYEPVEKGIDIKIATDMLVHAHRGSYDVAILVSGDTDFADAIQAVKDLGRHVEVVCSTGVALEG